MPLQVIDAYHASLTAKVKQFDIDLAAFDRRFWMSVALGMAILRGIKLLL